jgi:hypothetical protein
MNEQRTYTPPTSRQAAYLRYLMTRAHSAGVPYLPIEYLHRDAVEAWIEYLQLVVDSHEEIERLLATAREQKAQPQDNEVIA